MLIHREMAYLIASQGLPEEDYEQPVLEGCFKVWTLIDWVATPVHMWRGHVNIYCFVLGGLLLKC